MPSTYVERTIIIPHDCAKGRVIGSVSVVVVIVVGVDANSANLNVQATCATCKWHELVDI